jgi:hypothetical protein
MLRTRGAAPSEKVLVSTNYCWRPDCQGTGYLEDTGGQVLGTPVSPAAACTCGPSQGTVWDNKSGFCRQHEHCRHYPCRKPPVAVATAAVTVAIAERSFGRAAGPEDAPRVFIS